MDIPGSTSSLRSTFATESTVELASRCAAIGDYHRWCQLEPLNTKSVALTQLLVDSVCGGNLTRTCLKRHMGVASDFRDALDEPKRSNSTRFSILLILRSMAMAEKPHSLNAPEPRRLTITSNPPLVASLKAIGIRFLHPSVLDPNQVWTPGDDNLSGH